MVCALTLTLFLDDAAAAQESQRPPPSPPLADYPLLENVDSYISTPFTINQTQSSPIEFNVHNGNNFTLYNVQINNFHSASVPLVLKQVDALNKLLPNETRVFQTIVTTDTRFNETGKSFITWTILASNEANNTMESTMFHRDMTVVVPEFGSLAALFVFVCSIIAMIVLRPVRLI